MKNSISDQDLKAMIESSQLRSHILLPGHLKIIDLPKKALETLSELGELRYSGRISEKYYITNGARCLEEYFRNNPEELKSMEDDLRYSLEGINAISYAGV